MYSTANDCTYYDLSSFFLQILGGIKEVQDCANVLTDLYILLTHILLTKPAREKAILKNVFWETREGNLKSLGICRFVS
jgi:hypothetical protein